MFKTLKSKIILMIITLISLSALGLTVHADLLQYNGTNGLSGGVTVSGTWSGGVTWYSPGQYKTGWIISIVDTSGKNYYAPYIYIDMADPVKTVNLTNSAGESYTEYVNYGYAKSRIPGTYKYYDQWYNEEMTQEYAMVDSDGHCPWPTPFTNSGSSNEPAVRDWMMKQEKEVAGVQVPNAIWVIQEYFGNSVLAKVIANPEKFYLVLEPCATSQVPFAKDMEDDSIFCASAYGWGDVLNLQRMMSNGSLKDRYYPIGDYGQITGSGRQMDWVTNKSLPLSCYLAEQWDGLPSPIYSTSGDMSSWGSISIDAMKDRHKSYGMIAFKISDLGNDNAETHTWDDDNYPTQPEKAPEPPSDATTEQKTYTIVKSYVQVITNANGTKNKVDKGTYIREQTVGKVEIEDENHGTVNYKVKAWATSDTLNRNISSLNWINGISGSIGASGAGKDTVSLTATHKVLYVLLETGDNALATQTWDKTNYPTQPGKAPVAPTGAKATDKLYTIIKSYREKVVDSVTGAVSYNDKGRYIRTSTVADIDIMDEDFGSVEYKVINWKTSSTLKNNIDSINWQVPASIGETGTSDTSVVLDTGHKYLYVLLETDKTVASASGVNYTIPQSQITKFISVNNPESGSITKLSTLSFKWSSPEHNTTCNGHAHCGRCKHVCTDDACCDKDTSCDSNCQWVCVYCGATSNAYYEHSTTPDCSGGSWAYEHSGHHQHGDGTCNRDGCDHTNCSRTNPCSDWEWDYAYCTFGSFGTDGDDLTFGLWHSSTASYPDIVSNKTDWNKVTSNSLISLTKRTVSQTRSTTNGSAFTSKDFDLKTVIHRGKDKLTVALWKNDLSGTLGNVSSTSYAVSNTDSGTRQTSDYTDQFNVTISDQTDDNQTTYYVSPKASCSACGGEWDCSNSRYYSLVSAQSINGYTVKVQVYSGSPTGGTLNTTCETDEKHFGQTATNIVSGRMVVAGTLKVRPYIQMKYDNYASLNQVAYVLGEYDRNFSFNAYAEVRWSIANSANLKIDSLQWSTHAEANKEHDIGTVLPGGATLTLTMISGAEQQISVITYQPVLMGAGLNQVNATGGVSTLKTQAQAEAAHMAFVNSVKSGLSNIKVEQWWEDSDLVTSSDNVWDAGGQAVDHGVTLPSGDRCSDEAKYYFTNERGVSSSGLLDVVEGSTGYTYYTIWADPAGNIRMATNNPDAPGSDPYSGTVVLTRGATSLSGKAKEINDRTLVITKLVQGLEQGSGEDYTANASAGGWIQGNDGKWYNEAFDGVTYIEARTYLTIGFIKPKERMTVLDPKLCPQSSGQSDMFSEYYTSQFKMNNGTIGGTSLLAGYFEGVGINMHNIDKLYWSDKFYVPNATTQDLR